MGALSEDIALLSLSTVVLNSRDRQGNVWLPVKNIPYKTALE